MGFLCNLLSAALLFLYSVSIAYNSGNGIVSSALGASCVFERRGRLVSQLNQLYLTLLNVTEIRESTGLNFDGIWVSTDGMYTYDGDYVNRTWLQDNFTTEYRLGEFYGRIEIDISYSVVPIRVYYSVEIDKDGSYNITEYPQDYTANQYKIYGRLNYKLWDHDCTVTNDYTRAVISLYAVIIIAIIVSFMLSLCKFRSYIALRFIKYVIELPCFRVTGKIRFCNDKTRSPIKFKNDQEFCILGPVKEGKPFPSLGQLSYISYTDYNCIISDNLAIFKKNEKFEGEIHGFEGDELEDSIILNEGVADKVRSYLFNVNFNERYTAAVEVQEGSYHFLRLDKLIKLLNEGNGRELRIIDVVGSKRTPLHVPLDGPKSASTIRPPATLSADSDPRSTELAVGVSTCNNLLHQTAGSTLMHTEDHV